MLKLTRFDDSPIWLGSGFVIESPQPEGPNDPRIKARITYAGETRYVKEKPSVIANLIFDHGIK